MPDKSRHQIDSFFEQMRDAVERLPRWLQPLASGYLLGVVTNLVSQSGATSAQIWRTMSDVSRPAGALALVSALIVLCVPLARTILERYARSGRVTAAAGLVALNHVDVSLQPFLRGLPGWGEALCLAIAPDIRSGWRSSDIRFDYVDGEFEPPTDLLEPYAKYRSTHKQRISERDAPTVMLVKRPSSFTDSPDLPLSVKPTRYELTRFYRDNVATIASERHRLIRKTVDLEPIDFSNNLCMHAIVITADDKLLLTLRSPTVGYHPNTWSLSLEENLRLDDLGEDHRGIEKWAKRAIAEELALGAEDIAVDDLRGLAVVLEGDVLNTALISVVPLRQRSDVVNAAMYKLKADYEFVDWSFCTHDDLLRELIHPTRRYHPTSPLRMYLALNRHFGPARTANLLLEEGLT